MARAIQMVNNLANTIIDTVQPIFDSPPGVSVRIEAFTASNTSSVNASYKAYITTPSGAQQAQQPFKIVVWGDNDLGIGLVNQIIPAGGSLSVESSALSSIYFTVSGIELSSN